MSRVPRALKVRVTDYRPPGAGRGFPLERDARPGAAAWDKYEAAGQADAAAHDKMVVGLPLPILEAAARDLWTRRASNRRDPEERWTMERRASIARAILKCRVISGQ